MVFQFSQLYTAQYLTVETQSIRKIINFLLLLFNKNKKPYKTNKNRKRIFCFFFATFLFCFTFV